MTTRLVKEHRTFNKWYAGKYADQDGKFLHMPSWLKNDMRNAWLASAHESQSRITSLERQLAEETERCEPEIIEKDGHNPLLVISPDQVRSWLRRVSDLAGYADRSLSACQVTMDRGSKEQAITLGLPEITLMVSNIKNSRCSHHPSRPRRARTAQGEVRMAKIAYNACYGGFSLSHEAHLRYAEIKGIALFPEKGEFGFWTYWIVPKEDRAEILTSEQFARELDMEKRRASNEAYRRKTLCLRDVERHDPILIQIVEELGDRANGRCAKIALETVESGTLYRIDEYDGNETVATQSTYDWTVAP